MARGRILSKSLSTSERWALLFPVAGDLAEFCQSFYPLLVAHSDDFGRLQGDAHTVKTLVIPASPRPLEQVSKALQYLHDVNLIVWYDDAARPVARHGARRQVIQIVDFDEHQPGVLSKRTRSKFPEPPGISSKLQETPSQLNLTELKRTELNVEQEKRTAAPPRSQSDDRKPDENYRQILAIVYKEILPTGIRDIGELIEATKSRCARLRIAYDSSVVRKAVESALHTSKPRTA